MIDYLGMVREFQKAFGMPVGGQPKNISRHAFARRLRLITEELSEYCEAVGENDIVRIADALADLLWVVFGTTVEHGLPMDRVFLQVHASNMSKKDGHFDKSGKWIKPDNYKPVDLSWILNENS